MLKNYFKIAWRNLLRHKGYSAINVAGLAIGISACLLLFIVVKYELSYDKFQDNYARIYRVSTQDKYADGIEYNPGVPVKMLEAMRTQFPEIKTAGIDASYGSQLTVLGDGKSTDGNNKKFIEKSGVFFMDQHFFEIFHYKFLSGNESVLQAPNNVVLSKEVAEKYFGDWQNAIGKLVKLDNAITLKVAGIIENTPANSDLPLSVLISYETVRQNHDLYNFHEDWNNTSSNFQVYALLPQNASLSSFSNLLKQFCEKQYKNDRHEKRLHFLQPLSEMHFDTRMENFGDHITSRSTITTLVLIGLLIIIMACINFINLSTAQAVSRSKEVGVRKVLGGNRFQLFWQMMGETALIVLLSVLLAMAISKLALPYIKHISSVTEDLSVFTLGNIIFLAGIAVVITFFSGFYPALILSGFKPVSALKNRITSATIGGISLRRGLVILQFAISQVLIIGTIIAISQMNYVRNADLGFNKDAIYVLSGNSDSVSLSRQVAFKEDLLRQPGVQDITFMSDVPSSDNNWGTNFAFDHKKDADFILFLKFGDENYLKTFGLKLVAGRNYNYENSDTIKEALANETLIKKLGIQNPANAIGKDIRLGGSNWIKLVGVVKDFKTNSLRESIKPIVIAGRRKSYERTAIKMHSSNLLATHNAIEASWNKFYPEYAVRGSFLDEDIAKFYKEEEQLSLLYKIFAGLAIFISCLGLYGLVSFMAVQRVKEVGIRKVLGASIASIVYLFSKEFTVLIGIAFVIATPAAWYMMNNWLNNFVYKININIGVFVLAVLISIIIALITVGYKAVKAAVANPVKSLRSE
ncbi:MAG: ABC transporter permease [Bacteroidetes bacterium]|nr:ABC transporter permease [Bacteroidota bacterium]